MEGPAKRLAYGVYAQRVNASGVVQWGAGGAALCTAVNVQTRPAIASDGVGRFIVAWQDGRSGTSRDIYALRVGAGGTTEVGDTPAITALTLLPNLPNPFTGATHFRIRLPSDSEVSVEVYDVAGRRLRIQTLAQQRAGSLTIPFDGRSDSGQLRDSDHATELATGLPGVRR